MTFKLEHGYENEPLKLTTQFEYTPFDLPKFVREFSVLIDFSQCKLEPAYDSDGKLIEVSIVKDE